MAVHTSTGTITLSGKDGGFTGSRRVCNQLFGIRYSSRSPFPTSWSWNAHFIEVFRYLTKTGATS
jgi:hypothetical protein